MITMRMAQPFVAMSAVVGGALRSVCSTTH
jgi:hypothetical protein